MDRVHQDKRLFPEDGKHHGFSKKLGPNLGHKVQECWAMNGQERSHICAGPLASKSGGKGSLLTQGDEKETQAYWD